MSRRKPTLQLGAREQQNFPRTQKLRAGAGLGLLGSYGDGTDNEESDENEEEQTIPVSTLDDKVADFLKEINDLDSEPVAAVKTKAKETVEDKKEATVAATQNDDDFKIAWGPWNQCIDENTNHPYYWNTETNEVSWTLPESVMKQYESQMAKKAETVQKKSAKEPQKVVEKTPTVSETKPVKQAASKTEVLLKSRTSLKAALEEKKKELEKRQNKLEVKVAKPKKEVVEIDVDAELDNALDSTEIHSKKRKMKSENSNGIQPDVVSAKKEKVEPITNWRDGLMNDSEEDSGPDEDLSKYDMTPILPDGGFVSRKADRVDSPALVKTKVVKTEDRSTQTASEKEQSEADNLKHKGNIEKLQSTLLGKLSFLEISKDSLTDFHKLLMEIEVRSTDYKAGELAGRYFIKKLKKAEEQLEKYETNAVPVGWACQWDSERKRYFYKNKKTGQSQWTFPKEVVPLALPEETPATATMSPATASNLDQDMINEESKDSVTSGKSEKISASEVQAAAAAATGTDNNPVDMMAYPGATSVGYNMQNYQYWSMQSQYAGMPYGQHYPGFDPSFRNSPMREVPPPPPGEDVAPPPPEEEPPLPPAPPSEVDTPLPPPPPPPPLPAQDEIEEGEVNDDGIEMEISDAEDQGTNNGTTATEVQRGPVEYNTVVSAPAVLAAPPITANFAPAQVKVNRNVAVEKATKKIKKIKKDKLASSKKPPREMVGMVAKWQRAKQEIEEEEKRLIMESEEELNLEMDPEYRIRKWKSDQLQSGKAAMNANFEPISDDWKKKVKLRKSKVT